jgi:hypothetical protein
MARTIAARSVTEKAMKKPLYALLAGAAALLSACASLQTEPPANAPEVSIAADGRITVRPDPMRFKPGENDVLITWQLPKDSKYTFPPDGIEIADSREPPVRAKDEFINCGPARDGRTYSCLNRHSQRGYFKYTVRVRDGERLLPPHDPHIHNE